MAQKRRESILIYFWVSFKFSKTYLVHYNAFMPGDSIFAKQNTR